MADTENEATSPSREISDQTGTKVEDSNNNSDEVSKAPEDPAASSENANFTEENHGEDQPDQNETDQGESKQKADESKEDGIREDSNQKEESEDTSRQDPPGKDGPTQDEQEMGKSNLPEEKGETDQGGEKTQAEMCKEETVKDTDENQNQDGTSQERMDDADTVKNGESAEVEETPQKGEQKPVDSQEASLEVNNENREQDETDGPDCKTQEQTEQVDDSNEDEQDDKRQHETVVVEGKTEDNHEDQAGDEGEKVTATQDQEAEQPIMEDSSTYADTPSAPAHEPSDDATDHVQVSVTAENDTDSYGGTDFEIKYRAARKDVEKLRALNAEIQQRLNDSENREQQQAGLVSKDGMKVQAVYLARELSQQQDTEKYLREKLAEVLQEKEQSEQKAKDLELRLKRFVKDDQAKDARISKMEDQIRSLTQEFEELEKHIDEKTLEELKKGRKNREDNGEAATIVPQTNKPSTPPVPKSKTCAIV